MTTKTLQLIYHTAYDFLLNQDGINESILKQHLISESNKPADFKVIFRRFCDSAQNRQMSSKVIGQSIGGIQNLNVVLFDFDPHLVANRYSRNSGAELLDDIKKTLHPTGQIRTTSRSLWPQFCQSVIDSAHFLQQFDTAQKFYEWANFFANDVKAKPALPLMISIEIAGVGFPLACDILKELGYTEYGKPDVHLKDIFRALQLIDPLEKSTIKQDYDTLKAIDNIALANNETAYAVDKVFWLIGSGTFYLTGQNIGRQKTAFIQLMLSKLDRR